MQNLSCENEFYLHDNKKNQFHNKGFALGLVLKQRLAASRKWPIAMIEFPIFMTNSVCLVLQARNDYVAKHGKSGEALWGFGVSIW